MKQDTLYNIVQIYFVFLGHSRFDKLLLLLMLAIILLLSLVWVGHTVLFLRVKID